MYFAYLERIAVLHTSRVSAVLGPQSVRRQNFVSISWGPHAVPLLMTELSCHDVTRYSAVLLTNDEHGCWRLPLSPPAHPNPNRSSMSIETSTISINQLRTSSNCPVSLHIRIWRVWVFVVMYIANYTMRLLMQQSSPTLKRISFLGCYAKCHVG